MIGLIPSANLSAPAVWISLLSGAVDRAPALQDAGTFAGVPLVRCDEANLAMAMLAVVPTDEPMGPGSRLLEFGKAGARVGRHVLQGAESRLDEGVVVADAGAAVAGPP
jgi:hypothetical protein